jgi:hypothetical protein
MLKSPVSIILTVPPYFESSTVGITVSPVGPVVLGVAGILTSGAVTGAEGASGADVLPPQAARYNANTSAANNTIGFFINSPP